MIATLVAALPLALSSQAPAGPTPQAPGAHGQATFRVPIAADADPDFPGFQLWRPVCSGQAQAGAGDLRRIAENHRVLLEGQTTVIDGAGAFARPGPFNVVFVVAGTPPVGATAALASVESALESYFTDAMTVTINVSFAPLSGGLLGATAPVFGSKPWPISRKKIRDDMDSGIVDDTIQTYLPLGTVIRVNYDTITLFPFTFPFFSKKARLIGSAPGEDELFFTKANAKAVGFALAGADADMSLSTTFPFDFDPSNGVDAGKHSFQDVVIHEIGHALGFFSAGDFQPPPPALPMEHMTVLDLFRFKATDQNIFRDDDPDKYSEFQTYPRLVAFDTPDDDHATDLIFAEYRMSDGNPFQMSHFREQTPSIGLMDPGLATGQTFYPTFFGTADLAVFDAIGYDY